VNAVAPITRPGQLAEHLLKTDELLDRWGRDGWDSGPGRPSMHPLEVMRLLHDGETLGGVVASDEVMIVIDQAVCRAPARYKAMAHVWYRTNGTAEVKAKRLAISRASLYMEWRAALEYFRGEFRTKRLAV
jgi:hypothetical protein